MATLGRTVTLDSTFGACLIGVIASAVLYGVTLVQTYFYYTRYQKDHVILKSLVAATVVCDSAHLVMISHTVYHYLIRGFDDRTGLRTMIWSVLLEALFTGVTGALVQIFYVHRIWRLSNRNTFLAVVILALVLATAGCGTAWVIVSMQMDTFTNLLTINPLTLSINALTAAADIIIASSLVYILLNSRTGFRRSDTMITKLVVFTVNTGLLTSLCAISSLIAIAVSPDTLIYAAFYFCIGRLYANSLLATLNARRAIRGQIYDSDMSLQSVGGKSSSIRMASPRNASAVDPSRPPHNISIQIETTKDYMDDHKSPLEALEAETTRIGTPGGGTEGKMELP
ncbi:hypothetical protein PLICRDRAFT_371772 [Plicaturopsis crispa FD-325 SS-3]|uniref:Unplaced genomic scaffold PLICRscaffold_19, whole genome shotgun sequence n=1 Tax=Plicaturopsis crispa FD-325 SS-3 TaxID=944288 RepID=A0A0C9SKQ6_PLICR|nr:hypothetical protein PLICRDRAFT_371772 [Plicaturopsis crispa FD-325 SS-3]